MLFAVYMISPFRGVKSSIMARFAVYMLFEEFLMLRVMVWSGEISRVAGVVFDNVVNMKFVAVSNLGRSFDSYIGLCVMPFDELLSIVPCYTDSNILFFSVILAEVKIKSPVALRFGIII